MDDSSLIVIESVIELVVEIVIELVTERVYSFLQPFCCSLSSL